MLDGVDDESKLKAACKKQNDFFNSFIGNDESRLLTLFEDINYYLSVTTRVTMSITVMCFHKKIEAA